MSVIYAPPGSSSNVDYGSSTALGTSTSGDGSFAKTGSFNVSLQLSGTKKNAQDNIGASGGDSFTQTQDNTNSISITKTTSYDIQAPGPVDSGDGVNHDFDIILLWINPALDITVDPTGTVGTWTAYDYDPTDPANEVDIIPVYVGWLKNPSTMPAGVANALARTWGRPSLDGSGPGLTAADYQTILARDPFANGSTTIDPKRFDLTGQTFSYAPPIDGGAPLTQKFSLQYQATSSQGQQATDEYKETHSTDDTGTLLKFIKATFKDSTILDLTNSVTHTNTTISGQTATLTLTDPSLGYTGPTDLQVYQDNVYGTFMFALIPEQPVNNLWISPSSQSFFMNQAVSYQVGLSALSDFVGPVTLSAITSPAGCSQATFSPASITATATSTLTLTCSAVGNYTITVTGTGNVTHTATANLTITPAPFALEVFPSLQTAIFGSPTPVYTVLNEPASGFAGSVALSAAAPAGCGPVTFNPPTISGAGVSLMTAPSCPPGEYGISVSGVSSGVPSATASTALNVAPIPPPGGSNCVVNTTTSPANPVEGQPVSFVAALQSPVPGLNYTFSFSVDGQFECAVHGTGSCPGAPLVLSSGTHGINWQCASDGGAQTGAGTQAFTIGFDGTTVNLRPKYLVLSVMYAPPGQSSNVDYGTNALLGTNTSFKSIFSDNATKTITGGGGFTIGPLTDTVTVSDSQSFTQTSETDSSLTINKTQTSDFKVPGPKIAVDGIDHDFDVILVWINPVLSFSATSPTATNIIGYSYDPADPANEMDVVPIYVGWLKDPSTMPPGVAAVLARSWAGPPDDGSGPGLNSSDLNQILARDPFSDPSYVPSVNANGVTTDNRYVLVDGQTLSYATPPTTDQPLTQKFNLQTQNSTQTGTQAQDIYEVAYSKDIKASGSFTIGWLGVNLSAEVNHSKDLTWTNQQATTDTQTNTSTASLTLTGPSTAYDGPTQLQVFQDKVYGTFMFLLNPDTTAGDFNLLASPNGTTVVAGDSIVSNISLLPFNGFAANVGLTATVTPLNGCSPVTLSAASINTNASSQASLTCSVPGNYTLTVTGTAGSNTHTTSIEITVLASPTFALFTLPSQNALAPPGNTSFSVSATALGGFNGNVSFAVSGLPSGAAGTFTPASVTGSGSTTLSISMNSAPPAGTYPLIITATSLTAVKTAEVQLVVSPPAIGSGCTAQIQVSPAQPTSETPVTLTLVANPIAGLNETFIGSLDGNQFCTSSNTGCTSQPISNLASGSHAATWQCSVPGQPTITGAGTQFFTVNPGGSINPKYLVLSVMYAPPGQSSSVDYGSSKMLGTTTSMTDVFSQQTQITSSLTAGIDYKVPGDKDKKNGFNASIQDTDTQTFTQSITDNFSLTMNKTQSSDQVVPGPQSKAADGSDQEGIDHDYDVILLWINPEIDLTLTGPSSAIVNGYTFDENDPLDEMDIVPVYVAWLKDPSLMPPGVRFALARVWADQPVDGSGTGLTSDDFQTILARDPFANGPAPVDPSRFVLTGETFSYAPPPAGGQPITEKSSIAYQTSSQASTTSTDKYQVSFGTKGTDTGSINNFLQSNLDQPQPGTQTGTGSGSRSDTQTVTISSSNELQTNQSTGQTATLTLVGPSSKYTGPNDLLVYQDLAYGTFMFTFVPETNFEFEIAAPTQTVNPGASASYALTTIVANLNGTAFNNPISFSTSILPDGATASFSPATVNGAGSTVLTISTAASLAPGLYPFNIVGTATTNAGIETHVANATLLVLPTAHFTLSMTPSTHEINLGGAATYTISSTVVDGFAGSISLSGSGLPDGATYSFNPPTITAGSTSTLTVTPAASTTVGNYTLKVTGTSGLITQITSANVAVGTGPIVSTPPPTDAVPCVVNLSVTPATPIANQATTIVAQVTGVPPNNNPGSPGLTVLIDDQTFCEVNSFSCGATLSTLSAGPHHFSWSCSDTGTSGNGTGSGSQTITVSPGDATVGSLNPKFMILSVIYAPPGSKSNVDYGSSTALGTTTSMSSSFVHGPPTITLSATSPVAPVNPGGASGIDTSGNNNGSTLENTGSFSLTQTLATASSIAVKKTTSFDIQAPGAADAADGINHDFDIVLLWLNPVVNLAILDDGSAQMPGYSFDFTDPAGEADVVAVYVNWLKHPENMPPGIANSLARAWAAPPGDGSGPGLTSDDFTTILNRDPFSDPNYVLAMKPGSPTTTADGRFDLEAGESFSYEPPPAGGQPITEKFSLQYQDTSTDGQSTTDTYKTTFSVTGNIQAWITANIQTGVTTTLTNKFSLQTTDTTTQTASLNLVGPCFGYAGPTDVQVYQDNVYGTFMFAYIANTVPADFSFCVTPPSAPIDSNSKGTFTISSAPTNGFTGTVNLSVSGVPDGVTATLSSPSISGAGTATLSVVVPPTMAQGTYPITFTGTSGAITHTITANLVIKTVPTFTMAVTPASQNLNIGATTSYPISTTAFNGFTGNIALSAAVSPTTGCGIPAFSLASISGSGTSSLSISCPATGNYSITITGIGNNSDGVISQTATVNLAVQDFSVTSSPNTQTVAGGSAAYTLSIAPVNNFAGPVNLTASVVGSPVGVTTSFNPTTISGAASSILTVTTSQSTPVGNYTILVNGTNGNLLRQLQLTLAVTDFSVNLSPATQTVVPGSSATYNVALSGLNSFAGNVTLSESGLPATVSASFSPNPVVAGGSSTLTLTTSSSTAGGNYPFALTAASGGVSHSVPATLIVNAIPDFTVVVTGSQTVNQGSCANYVLTTTAVNGFTGSEAITISGIPTGTSVTATPQTIAGSGTSTLAVCPSATAAGTYTLTATVTSGTLTHAQSVTLIVTIPPSFSVNATPNSQTVLVGGNTTYTVSTTTTGGFSGVESLSTTGLPTGATATFAPSSISGAGSSVLSIATTTATPAGTYTLTLKGTSGTVTSTVTVFLVVTTQPVASLAPTSLVYPSQLTGISSAAQTITLSNTGSATMTISSIATSGDFSQTSNCGTSLSAGLSCAIQIVFTPSTTGSRTGTLTVIDNAPGSPHAASLSGTGVMPVASVSPTTLSFGSFEIGTSGSGVVTLTNTGTAALSISGINITGDFDENTNCGSSLAAGASCSIGVTFTPSVVGVRTGTLTFFDNAAGGSQAVTLRGSGTAPPPPGHGCVGRNCPIEP